jgi:hypothetical protein
MSLAIVGGNMAPILPYQRTSWWWWPEKWAGSPYLTGKPPWAPVLRNTDETHLIGGPPGCGCWKQGVNLPGLETLPPPSGFVVAGNTWWVPPDWRTPGGGCWNQGVSPTGFQSSPAHVPIPGQAVEAVTWGGDNSAASWPQALPFIQPPCHLHTLIETSHSAQCKVLNGWGGVVATPT